MLSKNSSLMSYFLAASRVTVPVKVVESVGRFWYWPACGREAGRAILQSMSASELLKQIKAMAPGERQKFLRAVLALEEEELDRPAANTKRVKWPDVEARARRIFGNRITPNLVLLEREEERV